MVPKKSHRFRNFGRNVCFDARDYFEPRTEREVLDLLGRHAGRRFHAVGALHSWSDAQVGRDVLLGLRRLAHVEVAEDRTYAEIGAGCSIYSVLEQLHRHGVTLPTVGMTGRQTLVGAISTATHGSGRSSLSHYVSAVRLAAYDENGTPRIYELTEGPALSAARCALGRMGIVLSIRIQCVPSYLVEEKTKKIGTIDEVLDDAHTYPLTQFYLVPWSWTWVAQLRRTSEGPRSTRWGRLKYRLVRALSLGMLNWTTVVLARWLKWEPGIRGFYTRLASWVAPVSVTERAEQVLMTQHRHDYVEAELFVPMSHVTDAATLVEHVLRIVAGEDVPLPADVEDRIGSAVGELHAFRGSYVHHYPITFRRVHEDSAMISMSSDEEMMAISLVTLRRDFEAFEAVVRVLATTMARAFRARPHWGKVLTLSAPELTDLIPGLNDFRAECERTDPDSAFATEFTERVLGF